MITITSMCQENGAVYLGQDGDDAVVSTGDLLTLLQIVLCAIKNAPLDDGKDETVALARKHAHHRGRSLVVDVLAAGTEAE